jgi:hypothetical protein
MNRPTIPALVLALGLVITGSLVGAGFRDGRTADRFVTVKGLSEREVEADLAIWPLAIVAADNDLPNAQAQMRRRVELAMEFLQENGIPSELIVRQGYRVVDTQANPFQSAATPNRFIITQTLMVRSEDVRGVMGASQQIGDLVDAGVVLTSGQEYGPGGPSFLFTRLNDLKGEMLAEATGRAQEAAAEFAASSQSRVGKIRRANQGVFQILPRDPVPGQSEANQLAKTVRVVVTVEYLLEG